MKNLFYHTLSILLLVVSVTCVQAQKIIGNGNVIKKNREVASFHSVIVKGGWDLVLTQGSSHALTVEADENFMEHLVTEVNDGVLNIYSNTQLSRNWRNGRNGKISRTKIHLTFKDLKSIKASGGSDVTATTTIQVDQLDLNLQGGSDLERFKLKANSLKGYFSGGSDAEIIFESIQNIDIKANGGSDLEFRDMSAEQCNLVLSGGSDADLEGKIKELSIEGHGGSDIDAYNLKVEKCKLDLSGSSDANISITGTLDVILSGGSDLFCKGVPEITRKSVCKSCDFTLRR